MLFLKLIPLKAWVLAGAIALAGAIGWLYLSEVRSGAVQEHRAKSAEKALSRAVERSDTRAKADAQANEDRAVLRAETASGADAVLATGANKEVQDAVLEADPSVAAAVREHHRVFSGTVDAANRAIESSR